MTKKIYNLTLSSLRNNFGGYYSDEILQKVATDRVEVILNEVNNLIADRATKGVSKSYIYKKYLVDSQQPEPPQKAKSASLVTSESTQVDLTPENLTASDALGLGSAEGFQKANIEGGYQDAN